jgi:hypothetical protein
MQPANTEVQVTAMAKITAAKFAAQGLGWGLTNPLLWLKARKSPKGSVTPVV